MSEGSLTDTSVNEQLSLDSHDDKGIKKLFKAGDGVKKQYHQNTCHNTISSSSQNDDKSEHYARLLKESQQTVSNRDILISMLQRQLKKMEELYKITLDQQQQIRIKYFSVVQELAQQNLVCDRLKKEVYNLGDEERAALQWEAEKWKKEYDNLVKAMGDMEKKSNAANTIDENNEDEYNKNQELHSSSRTEEILKHFLNIKDALNGQNEKLDKLLDNFQMVGDGGCTIKTSLEGMRCVVSELSRLVSSVVVHRAPDLPEKEVCFEIEESLAKPMQTEAVDDQQATQLSEGGIETTKPHRLGAEDSKINNETDSRPQSLKQLKMFQTDSSYSSDYCKEYFLETDQQNDANEVTRINRFVSESLGFSHNNTGAVMHPETSETSSNTHCECCLNYLAQVQDVVRENRKLEVYLEQAAQEIKELKELTVEQTAILRSEKCSDSCKDGVPAEKSALEEENVRLKSVIAKLETEMENLSAACNCSNEELAKAREARAETVEQSDRLLEKYKTKLETMNETHASALAEMDLLRNENKTLHEKIASLEGILEQHHEQCCLTKKELEDIHTRATCLEDSLQAMEEDKRNSANRQSEELARAKAENLLYARQCDELKETNRALSEKGNEEVEALKLRNESLIRELEERDRIIYELGEQVNDLEKDLNAMHEEMSVSNEIACREMSVLMSACVKLESQLEITKEIIVSEGGTENVETNTPCGSVFDEMSNGDVETLKVILDEKTDEVEGLLEDLEYSKANYDKELHILRNNIDILQKQLEREQDEHRRDLQLAEERIQKAERQQYVAVTEKIDVETEISERPEIAILSSGSTSQPSFAQFEEVQEQNRRLKSQLEQAKRDLDKVTVTEKIDVETEITEQFEIEILSSGSTSQLSFAQFEEVQEQNRRLKSQLEQAKRDLDNVAVTEKIDVETEITELEIEILSSESTLQLSLTQIEEIQEQNRRLKRQLERAKRDLEKFRVKIKEFGTLKAENSNLKVEITNFQQLLSDIKDLEENLKKSEKDKEEMTATVRCLESRLSAMQSKAVCQLEEKAPVTASRVIIRKSTINKKNNEPLPCENKSSHWEITEEESMSIVPIAPARRYNNINNYYQPPYPCDDVNYQLRLAEERAIAAASAEPIRNSGIRNDSNNYRPQCACGNKNCQLKIAKEKDVPITIMEKSIARTNHCGPSCACDDADYQVKTHVKMTYKDKKNKSSDRKKKRLFNLSTFGTVDQGNKVKKIQMHLTNMKQVEQQFLDMTLSVGGENQRFLEYNSPKVDTEKDMEVRLHKLKHKRQELSNSFNEFQRDIEFLEYEPCMPYGPECVGNFGGYCNCRNYRNM